MRQILVITALLSLAINGVFQTPKSTAKLDETKKHEQSAANPPNQTVSVHEQESGKENGETANRRQKEEIERQRQLAIFTGLLVAVGFLQFVVLGVQAVLFLQQKRIMEQHKTSLEQLAGAAKTSAGE